MGLNASTLNARDDAVPRETEIVATPFNGDRLFKIRLASPDVLAEGTSAALLKGKMLDSRSPCDAVNVALKVFRLPLNAEQKELYRSLYRRELEAAERLGTAERYILPYLGTSVLGYQPVIISLYMRHGNLIDYFVHNDVDRQSMILQVAEALAFLHTDAGMVHGDLKCENVLVADDGTPRLADFGLSTLVDKAAEECTTDASMRVWNTVRFAAPELLSDTALSISGRIRSKTTQSDVWAFGMLVVQAFTSMRPWPGFDNLAVAMKTLSGMRHPRPGRDAKSRGLTDAWWDVCVKCWETAPDKRPTIDHALEELRNAAASGRSFGIDLATQMGRLVDPYPNAFGSYFFAPPVVMSPCTAIEKHGMDLTTTYRSKGIPRKATKLKTLLDLDPRLVDFNSLECASDVDFVAEFLRNWLREQPEPIIIGSDLADTSAIEHDILRREAGNRLPDANYAVLGYLPGHLCRRVNFSSRPIDPYNGYGGLSPPTVRYAAWPTTAATTTQQYYATSPTAGTPTAARPFACDRCQACFSRPHDLKRHRASVHFRDDAEGPTCPQCARPFSRPETLRRHAQRGCHAGEDVYRAAPAP